MGAKVRVQLGLSTTVYTIARPANPDPGGPLNLSTVVHTFRLTWLLLCENLWPEVMTMAEQTARLVTIKDAARALAISRGQIYRLVASGALRVVKLGPNTSRVPAEDIERLIREGVPRAVIPLLRRRGGGGRER
jgi:excisionase family DNA binding protein